VIAPNAFGNELHIETYGILTVCVAAAAFVQGTIGVGFALIMVPLIAFFQPDLLPVFALALMIPLNAYVLWRERDSLDLSGAGWITFGRVLGAFGGLGVLSLLTRAQLNLAIGLATAIAAVFPIFRPKFTLNPASFLGAGVITGITETATGIGGPPLALVYQHHPGPVLRATIAACFLSGEIFSLCLLFLTGRADTHQIVAALWLLPPLALGGWFSSSSHRNLTGDWLRRAVLGFAMVSGVVLIIQAMF
jgi:uncharacterized membrane protein YfcA